MYQNAFWSGLVMNGLAVYLLKKAVAGMTISHQVLPYILIGSRNQSTVVEGEPNFSSSNYFEKTPGNALYLIFLRC